MKNRKASFLRAKPTGPWLLCMSVGDDKPCFTWGKAHYYAERSVTEVRIIGSLWRAKWGFKGFWWNSLCFLLSRHLDHYLDNIVELWSLWLWMRNIILELRRETLPSCLLALYPFLFHLTLKFKLRLRWEITFPCLGSGGEKASSLYENPQCAKQIDVQSP